MDEMMSDRSFEEVARLWLERQRPLMWPASYGSYHDLVDRYVIPLLGSMKTRAVTGTVVEEVLADLATGGGGTRPALHGSTLNSLRGIALRIAVYAREADGLEGPRAAVFASKESSPLTADEIRRICLFARRHVSRESLSLLIMLFSGLRMGEMCALSCDDISLATGEVHIHRSVRRIRHPEGGRKTTLEIGPVATKSHSRTERIPPAIMDAVRGCYRAGTFFLTGGARVPEPRTFQNRVGRLMTDEGIHAVTFQRIRKTYVTGDADISILDEAFSKNGGVSERECNGTENNFEQDELQCMR